MAVKTLHPLYLAMLSKWRRDIDSYDGDDAIKQAGDTYLKPTSGQIQDGYGLANTLGQSAYEAYKDRAVYPDIFKDAVEAAIGVMHREPPTIDLPTELEPLRTNCTLIGESLEMLLRRINARQLITGRLGIAGDIRKDGDVVRPVIALYNELAILNWDDSSKDDEDIDLRFVLLDESGFEMANDGTWDTVDKYRVMALTGPDGKVGEGNVYGSALVRDNVVDLLGVVLTPPVYTGQTLDHIPFVFVNSKDLAPGPDNPPLDGLAKSCLTVYRGEADYRQNLFMQGQDTLVRIGVNADADDTVRTGAGARIDVPLGGDAKYIGVSSNGLSEQRSALENDYSRAIQKSGQLIDATSRAKESGDALRIRVAAQTATLPQIAKTGAAGLERMLKSLAQWYGANPDKVVVTPNLNFTEADLNGQTLVQIVQAKALGAPISEESLHDWLRDNGMTKLTYEQELQRLAKEEPDPSKTIPSPLDNEGV